MTRRLKMTKRKFLEEAIHVRAKQLGGGHSDDVWSETLGAWKRRERLGTTIRKAREEFRRNFARRHLEKHAGVRR